MEIMLEEPKGLCFSRPSNKYNFEHLLFLDSLFGPLKKETDGGSLLNKATIITTSLSLIVTQI